MRALALLLAAGWLLAPLHGEDAAPAPKATEPPAGYHSVTPNLSVHDAAAAIAFYAKAFDARELFRVAGDDDTIAHAEIAIGDAVVMLADENPMDGTEAPKAEAKPTASVHLYVRDVDAVFRQAVAAGAKPLLEPTDMPWQHRFAMVRDPFNHVWSLATPKPGVAPPQLPAEAPAAGGPGF